MHIFNEKSLNETSVFYIVEGELDTLSIIDVGGNAIGLGGVSNVKKFFKTIDKNGKAAEQKFIIALDNDSAGKKTVKPLKDGFKERNIAYCVYNPIYNSVSIILKHLHNRIQVIITLTRQENSRLKILTISSNKRISA